jgi:outer membrane protein assembly factor BamB
MMFTNSTLTLACITCALVLGVPPATCAGSNWPSWRGAAANGTAPDNCNPPVEWSEEKNIAWKTPLPGLGHSTPVIWGERILLTTAIPFGKKTSPPIHDNAPGSHDNLPVAQKHRFVAMCIELSTGKPLWKTTCHEAFPHEGGHVSGSLASASPVTDGKHLIAHFGSHGLYCLDIKSGKVTWKKMVGRMSTKHAHGEGASPALYGNTVVVNWDHEGESALLAFDKSTGREKWKVERKEVTSWSTPLIVDIDSRPQVIVSASSRIRGYHLDTGELIWECGGMSHNVVASPVSANGIVYLGCSYDKRAMMAIRIKGAKGDITDTEHVLWSTNKRTPYVPSPLLYGDTLYYLSHYQGILSVIHAQSGDIKAGPFRIDALRNIYASPLGAGGHVYITSREGLTVVITHSQEPKPVAVNKLEDQFSASAAVAGNNLLLRGEKYLYCIAKDAHTP